MALEIDNPSDFGAGMADQLVTALVASKRFVVLERLNLKEVQDELKFQAEDSVDKDSAVEAGKLLGAQVLIRGAVTEVSYKKSSAVFEGGLFGDDFDIGQGEHVATITVDLKIVDVQTGQILDSVKGIGRVRNKARFITAQNSRFTLGGDQFESSPLARAVSAAITDGVKKLGVSLAKVPWEGRVIAADEDDSKVIYLNFGADSGLKVGDVLEVFLPGKALVDPATKTVLGRQADKVVGRCRLKTLEGKFSTAEVIEGDEIGGTHWVRLPRP